MARYHFHIDGDQFSDEGHELATLAEAKCEAVKLAGHAICDEAGTFWDKREWNMTVTDSDGLALFSLTFFGTEAAAKEPKLQRFGF